MARRLTVPRGGVGLLQLLRQQHRQPQRFWYVEHRILGRNQFLSSYLLQV